MFAIEKLLKLLLSGKHSSEIARRFEMALSGIMVLVGLAVIDGMLVGALLLLAFYGGYVTLLSLGVGTASALALLVLLALALALAIASAVCRQLKQLRALPQLLKENNHPLTSYLQSVAASFMQGFRDR